MKLALLLCIPIIIGVPITVLCLFMNGRNQTEETKLQMIMLNLRR